jgi:ubiquinone/menaquinone biosynthesis C-methylase UbiE
VNWEKEEKLGLFFDRLATEGVFDFFSTEQEEKLARFWQMWQPTAGQAILEPGCGSGRLTARLAEAVSPGGLVIAFDVSREMVRKARQAVPQAAAGILLATATYLPVASACLDTVICLNVFPHFLDQAATLEEIHRVLRPHGALWICHLDGRPTVNQRHRSSSPDIQGHLLPPAEELRALLRRHGFEVKGHEDDLDVFWVHGVRRVD